MCAHEASKEGADIAEKTAKILLNHCGTQAKSASKGHAEDFVKVVLCHRTPLRFIFIEETDIAVLQKKFRNQPSQRLSVDVAQRCNQRLRIKVNALENIKVCALLVSTDSATVPMMGRTTAATSPKMYAAFIAPRGANAKRIVSNYRFLHLHPFHFHVTSSFLIPK